jgi:AcrR family transcriptional regulator
MSPPRRTPETTAELRASLVAHAQTLVARDGASALTMRALAAEAGCAIGLPYKVFADRRLMKAVTTRIHETGAGPATFESMLAGYLAGEKGAGRVGHDVDENAFGFLLAGAIHNLIVSGPGYPRPTTRQLRHILTAVADRLVPTEPPEDTDATTR